MESVCSSVPAFITAMDALVIPSLWEEAFPFSALEGMSLGKPIVATRSGGLPELVTDDENGFLIEKRDCQGLVGALQRLATEPDLGARMGARARAIHRADYTLERFGERMEAAYQTVAGL